MGGRSVHAVGSPAVSSQDVVVLHEGTWGSSRAARVRAAMVRTLASCLLLAGLGFGYASCATAEDGAAFLAAALLATLLVQVLPLAAQGRALVWAATTVAVAGSAVAAVASPLVRSGLFGFVNQLITRFDDVFEAYVPLLPTSAGTAGWPFFVLAGVVAACAVRVLVERHMATTLTVLVFAGGAASLWLGAGAPAPSIATALMGWALVWHASSGGAAATLRGTAFVGIAAAAALSLGLGLASAYGPQPVVDQVRTGFVDAVETARHGRDSLPEGDLAAAASMNDGDGERLVLTFDQVPATGLLLRGFVGAAYEEGTWKPLDHTAYEGTWTGMFSWLDAQGFSPSTQRAAFDDEDALQGAPQPATAEVSVEAVGANRAYVYAPATLRALDGATAVAGRDGSLLARGLAGARSYRLEFEALDAEADVAATPAWLMDAPQDEGYGASEAVYRSFVEDRYLALGEADRKLVDALFYADATWTEDDPAPSSVISRVRVMLTTLASYTDDPVAFPAGERFLPWFLTRERAGNAAYFSTAAVMAFRAQGIPARYVEGYRADAATLARAAADGTGTVTLTSADAHAWVEIYLDGIGWAPVEVAPGFYDQPYRVGEIVEVNQSMAGDSTADAQQAGSVGGDLPEDDAASSTGPSALNVVFALLGVLAVLATLVCATMATLETRRAVLRRRRARRCASDDQQVAVPALFDGLSALTRAAGVAFDPGRPLAAAPAVAVAFPSVAAEEYERAVSLAQKAVFGCKQLRPHEMRALRRFDARLADELPSAKGPREAFARRYVHLL